MHFLTADGQEASEKINELRVYSSGKFTTVQQAQAGQLCAATGLEQVRAGDGLGKRRFHRDSQLTPTLGAKVILPPQLPVRTALEKLRILEDEDPTLGISFEEELQEIHIRIMGQIQLEVLRQLCSRRFGIELDFGDCRILYRETISQPAAAPLCRGASAPGAGTAGQRHHLFQRLPDRSAGQKLAEPYPHPRL